MKVQRVLPQRTVDGTLGLDVRGDSYQSQYVSPVTWGALAAADEGAYFAAVNATDNTAITSSIATAYSGTASGFVALQNTDTGSDAGAAKRIYLDYIKLITKVVPANATDLRAVVDIDSVLSRFTSGGTTITPVNVNMTSNVTSIAALNVGALTTVALSSKGRTVSRNIVRGQIPLTLETITFVFGAVDKASAGYNVTSATPINASFVCPPVVLGPGHTLVLSLFGTAYAITASTYQIEMGWLER